MQTYSFRDLAVAALAVFASAGGAHAQTVYAQAPLPPPVVSWTSHQTAGGGWQTFDNFILATAATVGSVAWRGLYWGAGWTDELTPASTQQWRLAFYSGDSAPTTLLAGFDVAANQVTRQLRAVYQQPSDNVWMPFYDFQAALPATLTLQANTTYWFSVVSRADDAEPLFAWAQGSGGYGSSFQVAVDATGAWAGTPVMRDGDRAFSLSAVPEPSSAWLMLVGAAGLAAALRRRV